MIHLEEIRLSSNHVTELPDWIGQLKALRILRLDNTGIRSLPTGLCDCAMLQVRRSLLQPFFCVYASILSCIYELFRVCACEYTFFVCVYVVFVCVYTFFVCVYIQVFVCVNTLRVAVRNFRASAICVWFCHGLMCVCMCMYMYIMH